MDGIAHGFKIRKSVYSTAWGSYKKLHRGFEPCRPLTLFCGDFNSIIQVQKALDNLRDDSTTQKLCFEDLLLSADDQKVSVVQDFLVQSTAEMVVVPEEEVLPQITVKAWTEITFLDNISSRGAYVEYVKEKNRFLKTIKRYDRVFNSTWLGLPLNFRVKVHLDAPMDVFSIIRLFQEITRDPAAEQVEFPSFLHHSLFSAPNEAAAAFAAFVDESTLRWNGPPISLFIVYSDAITQRNALPGEEPSNSPSTNQSSRKDQFARERAKYNSATVALLKECASNLEKLTLKRYRVPGQHDGSDESLSVLSSTTSRRASIDFERSNWS